MDPVFRVSILLALVLTTLVIAAGFLILTLSTFQATFLLGALSVSAALGAMIADLIVLPALVLSIASRVLLS